MNNAKKESYRDTLVFDNTNMDAWKYFYLLGSALISGTRHFPLLLFFLYFI
jgi:hypothetical protein